MAPLNLDCPHRTYKKRGSLLRGLRPTIARLFRPTKEIGARARRFVSWKQRGGRLPPSLVDGHSKMTEPRRHRTYRLQIEPRGHGLSLSIPRKLLHFGRSESRQWSPVHSKVNDATGVCPFHPRGSRGRTTFALRCSCGKSLGLRVITKSALPDSAQRQNASSLGSGEI